MRYIGLLMSVLFVLATIMACVDDATIQEEIAESESPAIYIDAVSLFNEYEANAIAAEAKFQGRTVIVTGVVTEIDEIFDQAYVTLTDGDEWSWSGVDCYFSDENRPQLAQLTKGQEITLKGQVDDYYLSVEVRGCTIQQ